MPDMNSSGAVAKSNAARKVSTKRPNVGFKHQPARRNVVLAGRNQTVAPVGAWVESGHEFMEDPVVLASLTEELQLELTREKEENLRRFQDGVRIRVALQAQLRKKRRQLQETGELAVCSSSASWAMEQDLQRRDGEKTTVDQPSLQPGEAMRQVRVRLAACQTVLNGEVISELPGGLWNVSPTRDKTVSRMRRTEDLGEEKEEGQSLENEEEGEDDFPCTREHNCPLVQQNADPCLGYKSVTFDSGRASEQVFGQPRSTGQITDRTSQVLWPLDNKEELKRQRQSQFLMYRRLFMDIEREQVQEHKRHRRHLKRIARIKSEKEQMRLQEERKLERRQQQEEARLEMEERELLVLEQLRLEEEERAAELERRKLKTKEKEATRFVEALRAQMKERLAQEKVDLPPLCCCGDGFWDSHPDTCANNCIFYHNPKAYIQALHSVLLSFDLKDGGSVPHRVSAHKVASTRSFSPR